MACFGNFRRQLTPTGAQELPENCRIDRRSIHAESGAQRSLRNLAKDRHLLGRMERAIRGFALERRPSGCKKRVGRQFYNLYRIRVANWKILYAIEDDRLVVPILDGVRRDQAYQAW